MPTLLERDTVPQQARDEVYKLWENDRISGSDVSADKELRQVYRDLGRRSLYFFTKGILGYPDLTKRTHLEYCRFLQNINTRATIDLLPRGCYKTTCGTLGFSLWYLLTQRRDDSLLIANQIAGNAELMLVEIEGHVDGSNSMINWLYPEAIKPGDRWKPWSSEQMRLPTKETDIGTPCSVMTIGVGTKAESLHFHIIINDDLIGEKAMASEREMLNAIAWHDYSVSLFVSPKTGIERVHGTRWDLSDLYSILLKNPKYKRFIKAAKDPETGELFFPEVLDDETLREIREVNYAHYMSQYMNDPDNPEVLEFRERWLNQYCLIKSQRAVGEKKEEGPACELDGRKFYVADMDVVLVVDPAASGDIESRFIEDLKRGRARKSNNAVGIVGLHGSGRYFLLDLWVGRGKGENPELQVAEKMMKMAMAWRGYVRCGYVEAYGAQRTLITVYNMLCRDNNFHFRIEEIPRGIQKAKKVRIRGAMGGPGQNGQICCRRHHDAFIYEFSKFPQLPDQMDTLDMFTWAVLMLKRPYSETVSKVVKEQRQKRRQKRLQVIGRGGY